MKASPRPWVAEFNEVLKRYEIVSPECGHLTLIAILCNDEFNGNEPEANAALIVESVNTHDRLVAENAELTISKCLLRAENERLHHHLESMCTLFAQTNRDAETWNPYNDAAKALKGE